MDEKNNKNFGSNWGNISAQTGEQKGNFGEKTGVSLTKINVASHKIFWGLVILAVAGISISGFYLYDFFSADREISLIVSVKDNVLTGVPFDLSVDFDNGSDSVLDNVKLSILLPDGVTTLGISKEKKVFEKEIGNIEPKTGFSEKIRILIFSDGESVKKFNVSAVYSSALGVSFEKKQSVEISVRESAIKIDLAAPEKVLNNEEFETIVRYSNISEFDFSGVKLNLNFPKNFIVKSLTSIKDGVLNSAVPALVGNVFNIGNLNKNQKGEIAIVGKISGENSLGDQSFFEINSSIEVSYLFVGQAGNGQIFKISEKTAKVNIAPSPLFLKIESNIEAGYVLPGNSLTFSITYLNNSDVGLSDIVIKAKLNGEMFDFSQLKTNASYNSRDNTLTWNAASDFGLRLIESGGSGAVEFEIAVKPNYQIKKLSDKNFVLKIAAEISSPTVPYYVAADKIISFANWEMKIAGAIALDSKIYFRDYSTLASGIVNKGSLPPKVDTPVNFIVHWIIKNYITDVREINIGAFLGPGVRFVGEAKSNVNAVPIYNERTQNVSWFIDKIAATKGVIGKPVEAVFQIELIPNANQVGLYPILIEDFSISAIDEFVNIKMVNFVKGAATKELSDAGFDSRNGEVVR